MRSRRRFGFGRKMLQAASVFAVVLSGASFASADIPDTGEHSVAYSVTSFRYLELQDTDQATCAATSDSTRADCAVDFGVLRNGESTDADGGKLYYATTLAADKITASLDEPMDNGVVLGVVAKSLSPGIPCTGDTSDEGAVATTALDITTSVTGFTTASAGVGTTYQDVVSLSTSPAAVINDINNCGASDTANGNHADLVYILDASLASDVDQNNPDYSKFTAVKLVTYTIEADTAG